MEKVFEIATNISTPLSLAGLFGAILFFILRRIVDKKNQQTSTLIVKKLFTLSLVAMILGFVSFIFEKAYSASLKDNPLELRGVVYVDENETESVKVKIIELEKEVVTNSFGLFDFKISGSKIAKQLTFRLRYNDIIDSRVLIERELMQTALEENIPLLFKLISPPKIPDQNKPDNDNDESDDDKGVGNAGQVEVTLVEPIAIIDVPEKKKLSSINIESLVGRYNGRTYNVTTDTWGAVYFRFDSVDASSRTWANLSWGDGLSGNGKLTGSIQSDKINLAGPIDSEITGHWDIKIVCDQLDEKNFDCKYEITPEVGNPNGFQKGRFKISKLTSKQPYHMPRMIGKTKEEWINKNKAEYLW